MFNNQAESTTSKDSNPIRISVSENNVQIAIECESVEEFPAKYKLLRHLQEKKHRVDRTIRWERLTNVGEPSLNEIKTITEYIWSEGESWRLIGILKDGLDAVVLALAKASPKCLKEAELVRVTDIPKSTIGDWLRGVKREVDHLFQRCNGGWQLSTEGVDYCRKESVPRVLSES